MWRSPRLGTQRAVCRSRTRGAPRPPWSGPRRVGDPRLLSSALDANASATGEQGRNREAWAFDPPTVAATRTPSPTRSPLRAGKSSTSSIWAANERWPPEPLARPSQWRSGSSRTPRAAVSHTSRPTIWWFLFTLQGRFEEALAQTEIMQRGWERAGRPVAGWLAPSFLAAALIHGLRAQWVPYQEFLDLAMARPHESVRSRLQLLCSATRCHASWRYGAGAPVRRHRRR